MDLSRWMEHLPERLKNIPIYQLLLPGSHDSTAFGFLRKPRFDDPVLNRLARFAWWPGLRKFLERWVLTQDLDLYEQLKLGIRKLNLLVNFDPKENQLYFTRGLATLDLITGIEQIQRFLQECPGEVIFLSVAFQENLRLPESDRLFENITTVLNPWLMPNTTCNRIEPTMTLHYLVGIDKRVFLICNENHRHNNLIWWIETHDLDGDANNLEEEWALLDSFFKSIKYARNIGRSFREITLNLSPNGEDLHFVKSLLWLHYEPTSTRRLAEELSRHMYSRLEQIEVKLFRKINFVSIDFVNADFVNWIIQYNLKFR